MLEATDVLDAARRLLTEIENEASGMSIVLPARRYVTVGGSVQDCEQVVVSVTAAGTGLTASDSELQALDLAPCPPVWQMSAEMSIVRCANEVPDGRTLPSVTNIELDTAAMSADAALLAAAIQKVSGFDATQMGSPTVALAFFQPQGGFVSVVASVVANLWADA